MKKHSTVNILVSLISIFLIFALAEIIMRFAWHMSGWVERPIYRRSFNPYLRYELIPSSSTLNISINSDGFRGPEFPVSKLKDTFRIIMLGDSETFSFMLPQKDALSSQLEDVLNKNSSSLHYEVLNFGVEGYNTFQELEQLKAKGLKYQPDLIILNYCLNDPEPGEYYFNKTFLMRHSALMRYFTYRIKKAAIRRERKRLKLRNEVDHYFYLHKPKFFVHVKEAILELADIAKSEDRKLVVVIFPASSIEVNDFKENYPYFKLHTLVKSITSDSIVFIDLIDEFNGLSLTPQDVSINYVYNESHKNASALKVVADYIYGILKSQELIS